MRRFVLGFGSLLACSDSVTGPTGLDASVVDASTALDAGASKDASLYVRPELCARAANDLVHEVFCGEQAPRITSVRELQTQLGIGSYEGPAYEVEYADAGYVAEDPNAILGVAVFLGHSTALSGHLVSPINPRAIVFGESTLMTFQRGVQQVEVVAFDEDTSTFNFYLVQFEQACNASGCTPGDLFTPSIESNWRSIRVRDAEELKNTPLDCRQCHMRGRDRPMLLMRELQSPWTHFFELDFPGYIHNTLPGTRGFELVHDYMRAKGEESYAGLVAYALRHSVGLMLQNVVTRDQPLLFDAPKIEEERWTFDEPSGTYATKPLPSATWQAGYEAFKRGDQLALPHFDARPTDPTKQAALTDAYQRYRAGTLPADQLPDLSDIFPDDPLTRAQIGLQNEPGATPAEALVQVCASCHNDVLDPTITRARFNVALARMPRGELDIAIERMQRASDAPGVMPPPEGRQLDPTARAALIEYLRQDTRSAEDDSFLEHAAVRGMTGGALP